jgi:cation diffusion facilitator family transporter
LCSVNSLSLSLSINAYRIDIYFYFLLEICSPPLPLACFSAAAEKTKMKGIIDPQESRQQQQQHHPYPTAATPLDNTKDHHHRRRPGDSAGPKATTKAAVETVPYGSLDHHQNDSHSSFQTQQHSVAAAVDDNASTGSSSHYYQQHYNPNMAGTESSGDDYNGDSEASRCCCWNWRRGGCHCHWPSARKLALVLSLYLNVIITLSKLVAYCRTGSLSVLAALLDSVLDVVSQLVLNYTERHSTLQRSSALYPAGAARLEPIGVLTCAALMGMASFEVLKESAAALFLGFHAAANNENSSSSGGAANYLKPELGSVGSMIAIVVVKLGLLWLCNVGANKRIVRSNKTSATPTPHEEEELERQAPANAEMAKAVAEDDGGTAATSDSAAEEGGSAAAAAAAAVQRKRSFHEEGDDDDLSQLQQQQRLLLLHKARPSSPPTTTEPVAAVAKHVVQLADPTLEALAQDHWNDCLSNGVAAAALLLAVRQPSLWFVDPIGAVVISVYIIYSWYMTGKEQIEHLTGKVAPEEFIEELMRHAGEFDDRILVVDQIRAYHFGPKFLVEIEVVMDSQTLLYESHDLGMDLQYEIEGLDEVERCFVHIDYQARPYDEHVVSKVPELREKYMIKQPSNHKLTRSAQSV